MSGIFLSGYACTKEIWEPIRNEVNNLKGTVIDWPRERLNQLNSIDSLADWVIDEHLSKGKIQYIVGHSMGGLVAAKIAEKLSTIEKIILIESYLLTPPPFFRNIVMDNTEDTIKNNIMGMLDREKGYYSGTLREDLQDLNILPSISKLSCEIDLIYGNRGLDDNAAVIANLELSAEVLSKVNIEIVSNACHFPMVENPRATKDILLKLLK